MRIGSRTDRDEDADHESDDRIGKQLRLREESGQVPASEDPERAAEEGQRADEEVEREQDAQGPDHRDPDPLHQRNLVDLHLESLLVSSEVVKNATLSSWFEFFWGVFARMFFFCFVQVFSPSLLERLLKKLYFKLTKC